MFPISHTNGGGELVFPRLYWFIERLKTSWSNKHWVTREEFGEIRRGN